MKKLLEQLKAYIQDVKSGEKRFSKDGMLVLFFSGLLIYVILLPTKNNMRYEIKTQDKNIVQEQEYVQNVSQENDYQKKLEEELAAFLSGVEGVGEVEVLIYLKETQEYIVEKDIPSSFTDSQSTETKSREERLEEDTVYTVNGDGEQIPFITQTKHPGIAGVVIAAEGAGQEEVRIRIIRTVMALYGVEANKIDVLARKKS